LKIIFLATPQTLFGSNIVDWHHEKHLGAENSPTPAACEVSKFLTLPAVSLENKSVKQELKEERD